MSVDPLQVAGAIVTVTGAAGAIVAGARWANARWRRVSEFLDDWNGEAARPGVPGRPGVMERLGAVEAATATIRAEVTPNGGGSLKDAVHRIDQWTRDDGQLLAEHLTWHRNDGAVDPTARVLLQRDNEGRAA